MPKPAYPYDTDLAQLLTSTGLTVPESLDLQSKCDAAVAEWETRTGWLPYLAPAYTEADVQAAEAAAQALVAAGLPPLVNAPVVTLGAPIITTRFFDPPSPSGSGRSSGSRGGRFLPLESGLLSLTSLAVGVVPNAAGTYNPPGVYTTGSGAGGTLLVPNLNFYLKPQNAIARGLAVTEVELLTPVRGVPQSIAITGVWGRVLALEGNVWQAVLQRAASLCAPELSVSISGGYFERKIGDSLKRFGGSDDSGPLAQQITLWDNNFNRCVTNKKRITV